MRPSYLAHIGILLVVASCNPGSSDPPAAHSEDEVKPACRITPAPGVTLTAFEDSLVRVMGRVCTRGDECVVRCLAEGRGRDIGGGCLHLCQTAGPTSLSLPEPPPLDWPNRAAGK